MTRRLFTFISVMSLLLCLGAGVLWVQSCSAGFARKQESYSLDQDPVRVLAWRVSSRDGFLAVQVKRLLCRPADFSTACFELLRPKTMYQRLGLPLYPDSAPEPTWRTFRFAFASDPPDPAGKPRQMFFYALVPAWSLSAAFALLPICWAARLIKRRMKRRPSECISCGYDLRASESRCPECGTPIPVS